MAEINETLLTRGHKHSKNKLKQKKDKPPPLQKNLQFPSKSTINSQAVPCG